MPSSWDDVWQQVNASNETEGERWSTVSDFPSRMAQAFYTYHIKPSTSLEPYNSSTVMHSSDSVPLAPSMIDIGCGQLSNARYFSQQGLRVVGVDTSPLHPLGPLPPMVGGRRSLFFYVADARQLPFPDATFDFAFSDGVFYYGDIQFFLNALAEANRILRIGGTLRFNVKSLDDMHFFSDQLKEPAEPLGIRQVISKRGWEFGLPILGFSAPALREVLFSNFANLDFTIGKECFHYTSLDALDLHSFLVVTATKRER